MDCQVPSSYARLAFDHVPRIAELRSWTSALRVVQAMFSPDQLVSVPTPHAGPSRSSDERKYNTVPSDTQTEEKASNQHVIANEFPSKRHTSVAPAAVQMSSASLSVPTRTGRISKETRTKKFPWLASCHDRVHNGSSILSGTNRLIRVLTEWSMFTNLYRPELSRINRAAWVDDRRLELEQEYCI